MIPNHVYVSLRCNPAQPTHEFPTPGVTNQVPVTDSAVRMVFGRAAHFPGCRYARIASFPRVVGGVAHTCSTQPAARAPRSPCCRLATCQTTFDQTPHGTSAMQQPGACTGASLRRPPVATCSDCTRLVTRGWHQSRVPQNDVGQEHAYARLRALQRHRVIACTRHGRARACFLEALNR